VRSSKLKTPKRVISMPSSAWKVLTRAPSRWEMTTHQFHHYFSVPWRAHTISTWSQVNNLREIQAIKRLSPHQNIVKLEEVLFDPPTGRLALVFELLEGNLYELIKGKATSMRQWVKPAFCSREDIHFQQIAKSTLAMSKSSHLCVKPLLHWIICIAKGSFIEMLRYAQRCLWCANGLNAYSYFN
jgi:serine/threonine protein kinase